MDTRSITPKRNTAMVKKKILLPFIVLVALGPPIFAKIPLRDAISQALLRSRDIGAQRLNEEAAGVRKGEAEARRVFGLDVGGTIGYASDSPHVTASDMPWVVSRLDESVPKDLILLSTPRVMYDLRLALKQPVYMGGSIRRAIEAEEVAVQAETEMTRVLEAKVASDVRASYFNYRVLLARKESIDLLRQSLTSRLQKIEKLFEAELARKTDVLETQLKIEEVRLSSLDLDQAIAEEKVRFRDLCGAGLEEIEDSRAGETPNLESALSSFRTSHPLLRYYDRKMEQAEALRQATAGAGRPQVSAFAQLHLGRPGIGLFNKTASLYVLGGLNIEFPLLDAKKHEAELALAAIEKRKLDIRRSEFLQATERDLRLLFEIKTALEAKMTSADRLAAAAEDDVRLKTRLYEESQIPNLDCLSAMSQLERYRTMKHDLGFQIEAVKARILALISAKTEEP
jgi:outer membrane protein TolC